MRDFLVLWLVCGNLLAQNSRLAEGRFFKFSTRDRGIHKITPSLLSTIGVDPSSINPERIRLFAGHQGMLPEPNAAFRISDLEEIPLWGQGEQDGKFDPADFFLFFAESAHSQVYDSKQGIFIHIQNIYSDQNFYFLEIESAQKGLRVAKIEENVDPSQTIDFYDELIWHEKEETNILKSGRAWYGERFGFTKTYRFTYNVGGINPSLPVRCRLAVMNQSTEAASFALKINGLLAGELGVASVFPGTYSVKGEEAQKVFSIDLPDANKISVDLEFKANSGQGFLDFFDLNFSAPLKMSSNQLIFRSISSTQAPTGLFRIQNAASSKVWDISNPNYPQEIPVEFQSNAALIKCKTQTLREFVAFKGSDFAEPKFVSAIVNQNLRSLSPTELLIVAPDVFLQQAQRLAEFRRKHDGMSVTVVSPEQIYNEFSSGRQDLVAIRDFIRHLYWKKGEHKLRYVLLFGDASYDYKDRLPRNTNFVPVFESYKSLHPIFSYSSDDFIGLLEEKEGVWGDFDNETVDVGIGRLTASTIDQAKIMVDKLIAYSQDPLAMGDWRKVISFVADDGDQNLHQLQADRLATYVDTNYLNFNVKKFYVDAFPQESDGGERRSPVLRNVLDNRVNAGSLIVNFTGHGAEYGWTSEGILDVSSIKSWRNQKKLPFFVTATCEFGRYDDPTGHSGAEEILIQPNGGGIGLITTTRPVFANTNYIVNEAFYRHALRPMQNGQMPRLGDLVLLTKNASMSGDINRNFALLGDPSLRLAYPENRVVIKTINNKVFTGRDTLSALERVNLKGQIQNSSGEKITNFNGIVSLQLFEKPTLKTTLGDEGATMNFWERENIIFRGTASVKSGEYEFNFLIPKDINYQFGQARLSFYATSPTSDASSDSGKAILGGGLKEYEPDSEPPQIKLYLENKNFANGQTVRSTPLLIAELYDKSGINISGMGVGRSLMAVLDDHFEKPFVLNQFYKTETDDFTRGSLSYQFLPGEAFSVGRHTLKLIAWDSHNNVAQQEIYFQVAGKKDAAITQFVVFPNPTSDQVFVNLCHNLSGNVLDFEAKLFSSDGKQLANWKQPIAQNTPCLENIALDLNFLNQQLHNGLFLLKISLSSSSGYTEIIERLAFFVK